MTGRFKNRGRAFMALVATGLVFGASAPAQQRTGGAAGVPTQSSSQVLFRIPEHDLYPESVAFDSVSGDYFLSSMSRHRILRVHDDGSYEDFLKTPEPNLSGSVGIKVDATRRRLWVCTGRYTMYAEEDGGPARTGLLLFDLDNGSLLRSWLMDQPSPGHIFNDVVIAADGTAYVTTTLFERVYHASEASEELELVLETPGRNSNGITLGPRGRYLFLALGGRIGRLDLESGELMDVAVPDAAERGTDGLYYHDGALLSVKPRSREVVRLWLNPTLEGADSVQVLAADDPSLAYPTTGLVVGNTFVFVGTSYADRPRTPGQSRQHADVLVHSLPLAGVSQELSVEEIVARTALAMGGSGRLEELKTLRFTQVTPQEPMEWQIVRPNLVRKERKGGLSLLFDGRRAGFLAGPARREDGSMEGPHLVPEGDWHHFELDIALYIPAFFDFPAEYVRRDEVDGVPVHVLRVTLPMGGVVLYHVDAERWLPIRVDVPDWGLQQRFGDFRETGGLVFPRRFWYPSNPSQVMYLKDMAINDDLDPGRFVFPPGIR